MIKVQVLLNTIDKVKNFVQTVGSCRSELDLATGRYVIDAKSIMGIFSLDIGAPLTLIIHEDAEAPALLEKLRDFLYDSAEQPYST